MATISLEMERAGYTVVDDVIDSAMCEDLIGVLPEVDNSGTRTLLSMARFRDLVGDIRRHYSLQHLLLGLVAVQCTLFRKSIDHNWAVRLHRDAVVPIAGKGPWKSSGPKEGMDTARPPREFLDGCIAVRVHLDGAPVEDISVVPGSHRETRKPVRSEAIPVSVPRGGALVMRPTLAHASTKLSQPENRRVLHYLFAPPALPGRYSWYDVV